MGYGDIIKRAWAVTWRYKALWVLGIFAGVSGCQGGNFRSNYNTNSSDFSQFGTNPSTVARHFEQLIVPYIPALIALSLVLFAVAVLFAVLSVAAKGGLVVAVNEVEEGRERKLGELWRYGFARFWPLVGLGLLLTLPTLLVAIFVAFSVAIPLLSAIFSGRGAQAASFAPMCGGLAIGVPLLIVMSFVLGIMYLIALRYLMIGNQGVIESASNAWKFFRNRFKDSFLFYVISGLLNIAAAMVLAIPIAVVTAMFVVPFVMSGRTPTAGSIGAAVLVGGLLITLIALLYNAVWGTFTSALWTIFFRRVTGLERPVMPQPAYYPPAYGSGYQPPIPPGAYPMPLQPPASYPEMPPQPPAPQPPVAPPAGTRPVGEIADPEMPPVAEYGADDRTSDSDSPQDPDA